MWLCFGLGIFSFEIKIVSWGLKLSVRASLKGVVTQLDHKRNLTI